MDVRNHQKLTWLNGMETTLNMCMLELKRQTIAIMESADSDTPASVGEALNSEDWRNAMRRELEMLETKGTWVEASKPAGRSLVDCRWVYALKRNANGKIIKYKARLVA